MFKKIVFSLTSLAMVLSFTATSAQAATPAPVGNPGGIALSPAHYDENNPVTKSYFIMSIPPGGTYTDEVIVTNTSDKPVDLIVGPVDGTTSVNSGSVYPDRSVPVSKWGKWLKIDRTSMTVAPKATDKVSFTVTVPLDAVPGDHLAGVAFDNAHPSTSGGSVSVTTVVRNIIGVLVQVPGPGQFQLDIKDAQLQPYGQQNYSSVVVMVGDKGRRLGKPKLDIKLDGPNGYHQELSRQLDTILPGDYIPFTFPWPDNLQPGDYNAVITGTGPDMTSPVVFTKKLTLASALNGIPVCKPGSTDPQCSTNPPPIVAQQNGLPGWFYYIVLPLIALMILIILGLVIFILKKNRKKDEDEEDARKAKSKKNSTKGDSL